MKLYVANCTSQKLDFQFRLPERLQPLMVHIPMGGQALVYSQGMTRQEVDYIIEKASVFGLVPIAEAERTPGFSGLCYSVDTPMSEDRIRRAMAKRTGVLIDMGKEIRKNAGVGVHNVVENHLNDHRDLGEMHGLKTEIIEQSPSGGANAEGMVERYNFTRREDPFAPSSPIPARRSGRLRRAG